MEFYNRKDLEYWKKQAELGKAVIIEIPLEMLLDLDISQLSYTFHSKISAEELTQWIEENRETFTVAAEAGENKKEEAERLEKSIFGKTEATETAEGRSKGSYNDHPESAYEAGDDNESIKKTNESAMPVVQTPSQKVFWIMEHTEFSEEQMGIIIEAMSQELPPRYLLCFMKKEYSPSLMRKLKNYCMKMYQEEQKSASPEQGYV